MKYRRIEKQIIAATLVIVLVVLGCSLAAYMFLLNRNQHAKIRNEIASARAGARLSLEDRQRRAALVARLLAANEEVGRALPSADEIEKLLLSVYPRLDTDIISVIDLDGVIVAQLEPDPIEKRLRVRRGDPVFLNPLFRKAALGLSPSGVELCLPDIVCAVAYSPVIRHDGNGLAIAGFVRAAFTLNNNFASDVRKTTGTDYILLKRDRALASSIPAGGLPDSEVRRLSEALAGFASDDTGEKKSGIRWLKLSGKPFALESAEIKDASGRVIATRVVGRDTSDVERARMEGLAFMGGIAVIAFILSIGFSFFVARRIFRPLNKLLESVRSIAEGHHDTKIAHDTRDEIGELAAAFNDMSDAVDHREKGLREAAEEIKLNQEQLIQSGKLAAIGELAAGVAHEIGNPLSAVSGYAQMLAAGNADPEKVKEYAAEIEKEAEFIEKIIQDLLDFSRPSGDSTEDCYLKELLDSAIRTASSHSAFKEIKVEKKFAPDIPPVQCNRKEIIQVFINLLVNAAQAMPDGGMVSVEGELGPDMVTMKIMDTGPGVAEKLTGKVFDPFFTTKPPGIGTGLGLSICYSIIKKHGGRITVKNTDPGACFTITLPVVLS